MSEETIGRALRTRRALLGLDQRDAATRIGMSRTTYSSYERDTQRPSVDVLPAIADFLEVSVDAVLALYGASAIAAARTALGRLNSTASSASSRTDTDIHTSDIATTSDVSAVTGEFDDGYVASNGVSRDKDAIDSSPYHPVMSIDTIDKPRNKVSDNGEKGKKKKKKKGKREKLVDPAFASHV